jgi:hypothetical protein
MQFMHDIFPKQGAEVMSTGTVRYPRQIIFLIIITILTNVSGSLKLGKAMESYL